jgi:WD40 repeat protein
MTKKIRSHALAVATLLYAFPMCGMNKDIQNASTSMASQQNDSGVAASSHSQENQAIAPVDRNIQLSREFSEVCSKKPPKVFDYSAHKGRSVNAFDFSYDGKQIIGAIAGTIQFWDSTTGEKIREIECPAGDVTRILKTMVDGRHLIVHTWEISEKDEDLDVIVLNCIDLVTGKIVYSINMSPGDHENFAYNRRGLGVREAYDKDTGAISSNYDLEVFDSKTGEVLRKLQSTEDSLMALKFSPDGSHLMTLNCRAHQEKGKLYYTIKIWDIHQGKLLKSWLTPNQTWLNSGDNKVFDLSLGGNFWALIQGKEVASVYDGVTGRLHFNLPHGRDREDIISVLFSPDGTKIATGGKGRVKVWSASTGELIHIFDFLHWFPMPDDDYYEEYDLAFSQDSSKILFNVGSKLFLWDLNDLEDRDITLFLQQSLPAQLKLLKTFDNAYQAQKRFLVTPEQLGVFTSFPKKLQEKLFKFVRTTKNPRGLRDDESEKSDENSADQKKQKVRE